MGVQAGTGQPDPRTIDRQLSEAVEAFTSRFGRPPRFGAAAPGRVNLIGEHTDYNNGFVLPMAIDRWAIVVADLTPANNSTLWAIDLDQTVQCDFADLRSPIAGSFANYLLGVVDQFAKRGDSIPNLDLALTSTVPIGAGLASSAAIEVATATLLAEVVGAKLDPIEKALLCQRAEHTFPGTPCGIMDMLIATLAQPNHALLIDCQSNTAEPVPLPPADSVTVLIANTNVHHDLAASAYAARRESCRSAAAKLGLATLREASATMGISPIFSGRGLTDRESRCAEHVVCENERVLSAAAALGRGDLETVGGLMFDSHASLRDLYDVSCPELDLLVEVAAQMRSDGSVFGARMTGGGFGGCAVLFCRADAVTTVSDALADRFSSRFTRPATLFTVAAVGASGTFTL
ncbi:MAG: galactokinase [Planctomycetes bacterium]|nr:galactokinase [Planctomycetota bacterium]